MSSRAPSPKKLVLGVDLGGTKIAAALFDETGALVGRLESAPTLADRPREETLASLFDVIERARAQCPAGSAVEGIGVGSTGPLDPGRGTLLEAASLPNLFHFPISHAIEERFHVPVSLTNDGNAFALAEARHGAGKGHGIVLGITLGTGCGCGVVIHGKILEGATANTGEVYRAPVAGGKFDEVLSGNGLRRRFRELSGREVAGREITRLADDGDPDAREAFARFGRDVGEGVGIIAAVLDPSVTVLGGSVSAALRHFLPSLRSEVSRHVAPRVAERMQIVPAKLGSAAGAVGAAALIFSGDTIR